MSTVAHSVRWVAAETLIARGTVVISAIVVGRALGPKIMGAVAVILLLRELSNIISNFGLSQAIIQHPNPSDHQLATLYTLNWILGLIAFLGIVSTSPLLATYFGEPVLKHVLPIAGIGFLLEPIGQQVNAQLQKAMDFGILAKTSITSATITAFGSICGVYMGYGIWAIVAAGLASSAVRQCIYIWIAFRRHMLHGFALDIRGSKNLLSFGLFRTGADGLNMVNSRIDQFIIGGLLGSTALGIYSMAQNWTLTLMQQINAIATRVAFPAIAGFQHDLPRVRAAHLRLVNRATTVNAAVFFGMAAVAHPLIMLVMGPEWEALIPVLQLMCGYVLLRSLGNLNGPLAMGLGKANWAFYWNIGLAAVVPLLLWLSAQSGRLDVIVGMLILLQLSLAVLMYFYWTRRLIGPCFGSYVAAVFAPWGCGAAMAIGVWVVLGMLRSADSLTRLVAAVSIGAALYIAMNWVFNRDALRDLLGLLCHRQGKTTEADTPNTSLSQE